MCKFEYQNGDYIRYQCNKVFRITDVTSWSAIDENNETIQNIDLCCPNISLCKDVLLICGFVLEDKRWVLHLPNSYRVVYDLNDGHCKIYSTTQIPPIATNEFMTLLALQHFVRNNVNCELEINHHDLAKYVRENYH